MDCHFFLQGIFLTQGLNLGLLHHRRTLYHLSPQGRFLCPPLFPGVCSQCALDKWWLIIIDRTRLESKILTSIPRFIPFYHIGQLFQFLEFYRQSSRPACSRKKFIYFLLYYIDISFTPMKKGVKKFLQGGSSKMSQQKQNEVWGPFFGGGKTTCVICSYTAVMPRWCYFPL